MAASSSHVTSRIKSVDVLHTVKGANWLNAITILAEISRRKQIFRKRIVASVSALSRMNICESRRNIPLKINLQQ